LDEARIGIEAILRFSRRREAGLAKQFATRSFRSSNQELEPSTSLDVLTAPLSMEESMKTLLIISLLGVAALIGSPALAQNPQPADRPAAANPAPSDANKMMLKAGFQAHGPRRLQPEQ
jgi:hypothetical protein